MHAKPHSVVLGTLLVVCLAAPACSSGSPAAPAPAADRSLIVIPYPTTGPVVVVAIDNHFHDIHPSDHREVSVDQPLVVKNEGRYRHNFTIVGTEVSEYLEPLQEARWPRIGGMLSPGHYVVICRIHQASGMGGEFTVLG
jgi:plastocyanin